MDREAEREDIVIAIASTESVVEARQRGRDLASQMGFTQSEATMIAAAISELARNTIDHGGGGSVRMRWVVQGKRKGLRLDFVDAGRGISNVELALRDGYTTGTGLGLGLSGSRRLMSEFEIESEVGKGTHVSVTRWT